eukprot:scaffold51605_cov64-Phaeocystis_antarctica.AAC.6
MLNTPNKAYTVTLRHSRTTLSHASEKHEGVPQLSQAVPASTTSRGRPALPQAWTDELVGSRVVSHLAVAEMRGTVRCLPLADDGRALSGARGAPHEPALAARGDMLARCAPMRSCRRESSSCGSTEAAMLASQPRGRAEGLFEPPPAVKGGTVEPKALRTMRERSAVARLGPLGSVALRALRGPPAGCICAAVSWGLLPSGRSAARDSA